MRHFGRIFDEFTPPLRRIRSSRSPERQAVHGFVKGIWEIIGHTPPAALRFRRGTSIRPDLISELQPYAVTLCCRTGLSRPVFISGVMLCRRGPTDRGRRELQRIDLRCVQALKDRGRLAQRMAPERKGAPKMGRRIPSAGSRRSMPFNR